MLDAYRRHTRHCKFRSQGRNWARCNCPIWVSGYLNDSPIRQTLGTRDWQRALARIADLEAGRAPITTSPGMIDASRLYLTDCEARGLAAASLYSYRTVLRTLPSLNVAEITPDDLTRWRADRKVAPSTARKELECLRAFFRYAVAHKWRADNPAAALRVPRDTSPGALPFERHEIIALLAACDRIDNHFGACLERARLRARALVLVLLYTGLRISDAAQLRRSQFDPRSGYLSIRTQKTGQQSRLKLHRAALDALDVLPREHADYWFWSGECDLKTVVNSLRRTIAMLGRLAGVHAHPHRFRDTFASELLTAGVDIRTVSLLLGHRSVRTTEKHYAHFVAAHQALLDGATARLPLYQPEAVRPFPVKVG